MSKRTEILIVSDSHGNCDGLCTVLAAHPKADLLLFLGDGLTDLVSAQQRAACPMTYEVRGNCDSRIDEMLLRFKIEDSKVTYLNGYRIDLIHGDLLTSDLLSVNRGDILMFGHTHVYMLKKEDGVVYFNPGSTSFPKNGNPATYGLFEDLQLSIRRLDDDEELLSMQLS